MARLATEKNWNDYVIHAEEIARSEGFRDLRDRIVTRAEIGPEDSVVDLGAGTGLLSLLAAAEAKRVWAVDLSDRMCEYLATKARSAGLDNVETVASTIVSLPLVDSSAEVAISNYCFHHLSDSEKLTALREVRRVLLPGGRLVIGDMMFSPTRLDRRSRAVLKDKVLAMFRKGPAGLWRLVKNAFRFLTGRWERPVTPEWWENALRETGFVAIEVQTLEHEGGIVCARKP
jgi:ubiquinone/menaquinone biosynthesis C-methylase UbiE